MHIHGHRIPPHVIHLGCQGTISASFVATLVAHHFEMTSWIEPTAACVSSVLAAWIPDIERRLRHPQIGTKLPD